MLLQEEYFKRHNLNVPLIPFTAKGALLLSIPERPYLLLTFEWKEFQNHPGRYYLNYFNPSANGLLDNKECFVTSDYEKIFEWDDYYYYFMNFAKGVKLKPVVGEKEVVLAFWEILICYCDQWLANYGTKSFKNSVFETIDKKLTFDERFDNYKKVLAHIMLRHTNLFEIFRSKMMPYTKTYSHWLGNLILRYQACICKEF
jgi:hypothetical protein